MPTYNSPGTDCLGHAQPGLVALRDALLPKFFPCYDLGIYNCRTTRGGDNLSLHGEGRAWDAGFPGTCHTEGTRLAEFLVANADALGVQRVIWCGKEWGGPGEWFWEPYYGQSQHTDHVHVELNWDAATNLTRQQVETIYAQEGVFMALTDAEQKEILDFVRSMRAGSDAHPNYGDIWNKIRERDPGSPVTPNWGDIFNDLAAIKQKLGI